MSPPQLTGNTPILQIIHPREVHVFVLLGHEFDTSVFHGLNGGFTEYGGSYVPLIGKHGLDGYTAAIAKGLGEGVIFNMIK